MNVLDARCQTDQLGCARHRRARKRNGQAPSRTRRRGALHQAPPGCHQVVHQTIEIRQREVASGPGCAQPRSSFSQALCRQAADLSASHTTNGHREYLIWRTAGCITVPAIPTRLFPWHAICPRNCCAAAPGPRPPGWPPTWRACRRPDGSTNGIGNLVGGQTRGRAAHHGAFSPRRVAWQPCSLLAVSARVAGWGVTGVRIGG